jgi:hypothetical protein
MMLAGLPVPAEAVDELAGLVREAGADDLADRLERALETEVKLLALTLDERALSAVRCAEAKGWNDECKHQDSAPRS